MEVQDIAIGFRENNARLVPLMLKRLHALQAADRYGNGRTTETVSNGLPETSAPGSSNVITRKTTANSSCDNSIGSDAAENTSIANTKRPFARFGSGSAPSSPDTFNQTLNGSLTKFSNTINLSTLVESSQQSNDYKYVRSYTVPIHPATSETYQMLTLRYLASLGEYQEFLGQVFEHNALQLIFRYVENIEPKNTCLAFEALKYLSSLLCHKKFSLEFINNGGIEVRLKFCFVINETLMKNFFF